MLAFMLILSGCGVNPEEVSIVTGTPEPEAMTNETADTGANETTETEEAQSTSETEEPAETTETEEEAYDPDSLTLKERYADNFLVGCAMNLQALTVPTDQQKLYLSQFNSLTMENETKPDSLLNQSACSSGLPGTYTEPVINTSKLDKCLSFCQENDISLRGHVLVWYSQTPAWFFTEDYTANGALVSKEVMLSRMESYIRQVLTYCQENYSGVIYAWDVVNEAIDPDSGNDPDGLRTVDNLWYTTVGPDYVEAAFTYARKYVEEGVDLYYNDYNCYTKTTEIKKLLQKLIDKGLIDGMGMQCHFTTSNSMAKDVYYTALSFAELGLKISITELDIGMSDGDDEAQAIKYKVLFERLEEAQESGRMDIQSVTVWGLYDQISWRKDTNPLLFTKQDGEIVKKRAWYGAMQADDIMDIEW